MNEGEGTSRECPFSGSVLVSWGSLCTSPCAVAEVVVGPAALVSSLAGSWLAGDTAGTAGGIRHFPFAQRALSSCARGV